MAATSEWRDGMRPGIVNVIQDCKARGNDLQATRKALRAARPYYAGELHPYRMWLKECKIQLGIHGMLPRNECVVMLSDKGEIACANCTGDCCILCMPGRRDLEVLQERGLLDEYRELLWEPVASDWLEEQDLGSLAKCARESQEVRDYGR